MTLRELTVIAGAAVSMFACRGQDDDVRSDVVPPAADSLLDSVRDTSPPLAPPDSTRGDTASGAVRPPPNRRVPSDTGDSNAAAPPERNPPIGDPAPTPRPPVKLPRGDST